jgi:hypothetical protein
VYSPVDNPMEVLSPKVDNVDFHQSDQGLSGDVAGLLGVTSIITSDLEIDNKDAHSPMPLTSGQKSESEGNVGDEMLGFSASQPLASLSGTPSLIRSHRFLFHIEIVYMNVAGRSVIASPPKWLPLVEVLTSSCTHQEGTKVSLSHTSPNLQATKAKSIK